MTQRPGLQAGWLLASGMRSFSGGWTPVVRLGDVIMILELHREGVSVSDIARRTGLDRKTVRKYIARGLDVPTYSPRPPRPLLIDGYAPVLRERVTAFPELSGRGWTGA